MNKKIGIAIDTYKLPLFRQEISNGGFEIFSVTPLGRFPKLSLITVHCNQDRIIELKEVMEKLQNYFKSKLN